MGARIMNLGAAGFFQSALYDRESAVSNVAQLMQDARWPWRPNLYDYETLAPKMRTRKDKSLKRDEEGRLAAGLRAPDRGRITLMSAPTAAVVRCACSIATGREGPPVRGSHVYTAC